MSRILASGSVDVSVFRGKGACVSVLRLSRKSLIWSRSLGLHLLGLALLLGIAFCTHLGGAWVWDDIHLVANNPNLSGWAGLRHVWSHDLWGGAGLGATELYHPIPMTLVWAGNAVWGKSLVAFRIANLLLHATNSLLFAAWLRRGGLSTSVSVGCALLVAVHPMVTEPVMWVTGSHDLLATMACLVALTLWPSQDDARPIWRIAVATFAMAWAGLCKEPYLVVPAILACLLVRPATRRFRVLQLAGLSAPMAAVAIVLVLRHAVGVPTGSAQLGVALSDHVINHATIVRHYLVHLLTFDNPATTESFRPLSTLAAAATMAVLLAILVGLVLAWRRGKTGAALALVGWLWFLLALLPHTIATPTIGMYGNRYAYFPMLGLATLVAALLDPRVHQPAFFRWRQLRYAMPAAALVLALVTFTQSGLWQDEFTLFGADVDRDPTDAKALSHYATALVERSGCPAALPYFAKAVRRDRTDGKSWHNIAGCLINAQRFSEALGPATLAEELQPNDAGAAYNLGLVNLTLGRQSDGVRLLEKALRLRPDHDGARRLLDDVRKLTDSHPAAP